MAICYKAAWTRYEDIAYTGEMFNNPKPVKDLPTADSLRAAAKVLEEKAKELDKPKFTGHQKRLLEISSKHDIDIIKFRDSGYSYVGNSTDWGTEEGEVATIVHKHKSIMFSNHKYNSSTCTYINYITILDEDDEVHTYLKWN